MRGMSDLTNSQQFAVLVLAHHGMDCTLSKLAEQYPISADTLGKVRNTYPDLVRQTEIDEEDLEKYTEKFKEVKRTPSRSSDNKDSDGDGNNTDTKTDAAHVPRDEKEYPDDFTETYKWFIEKISDSPNKSKQEIEDEIPDSASYSAQNYYNTVRSYPEVIKERIKEKGTAKSEDDLHSYLQKYIDFDSGETDEKIAGDAENNPSDTSSTPKATDETVKQFEGRLKSVESKVEKLRHDMENGDGGDERENERGRVELAEVVIESMSDEELGRIVRGAIGNE